MKSYCITEAGIQWNMNLILVKLIFVNGEITTTPNVIANNKNQVFYWTHKRKKYSQTNKIVLWSVTGKHTKE